MTRFSTDSKEYQAIRSIAFKIMMSPGFNEGKTYIVRMEMEDLRRFEYGGEYVFRDLSDEEILALREEIFIKECGWSQKYVSPQNLSSFLNEQLLDGDKVICRI